ncbi:MAG: pyridoxamine 5'-phosphate oxidase family protein [Rhizobiales bacterium]|nr:pyridoxamine 5'-phosphate oxidase family protein [Hyphomicrobiales bacterium]
MQITTLRDLTALYKATNPISLSKETAALTPAYRRWIERAPFFAIATSGPGGLDCSPRGDAVGQAFRMLDEATIAIPDRRGNNRLDTLKNIIHDPKVALLFLTPGIHETVRINGTATITTDPELVNSFAVDGKLPATVIVVGIEAVYFQCARALKRARLWERDMQIDRDQVPSAGEMTKSALPDFDAEDYDADLQGRQAKSLY